MDNVLGTGEGEAERGSTELSDGQPWSREEGDGGDLSGSGPRVLCPDDSEPTPRPDPPKGTLHHKHMPR